ncbi:MAG: hypothetical protein CFH38_01322, partial [Alphaproteobacteria bacterium MarineAlpha10_Bin1]
CVNPGRRFGRGWPQLWDRVGLDEAFAELPTEAEKNPLDEVLA